MFQALQTGTAPERMQARIAAMSAMLAALQMLQPATEALYDALREAAAGGARLVVLQELHRTRYFCQVEETDFFDLAEAIPGPTSAAQGR